MRTCRHLPAVLLAAGMCILPGLGCTLLLEPDAAQCRSDGDCARFPDAICNRNQNICVPRDVDTGRSPQGVTGGKGGATEAPGPPPDGGVATDAAGSPATPACSGPKPVVRIEGEITADDALRCDRDYLLVGTVFVKPGVTLAIAPGTTIRGENRSKGTLVVQPGGKLLAVGLPDQPILFTSEFGESQRRPGDWGGVILLGRAPVNIPDAAIEGLLEGGAYGGDQPNDSSGALKYVRIEYSGTKIGPNNEINGLTFGGVGRGTVVDYIQVRMTTDDCFEFFGGTVNAKHLVCQRNQDDGFDFENGYQGKLQFLVLQQDPDAVDETNGFESDNDATGSSNTPLTNPTVYNVTLCGKGQEIEKQQYGLLLRRSSRGLYRNLIVSGFEAGLDIRDATTSVDIAHGLFHGNLVKNLAYEESGIDNDVQKDDDAGFDEIAWLTETGRKIGVGSPGIDCFEPTVMKLAPKTPLTELAVAPPDDGFFDAGAAYLGAFKDESDDWAKGAWVVWQPR